MPCRRHLSVPIRMRDPTKRSEHGAGMFRSTSHSPDQCSMYTAVVADVMEVPVQSLCVERLFHEAHPRLIKLSFSISTLEMPIVSPGQQFMLILGVAPENSRTIHLCLFIQKGKRYISSQLEAEIYSIAKSHVCWNLVLFSQ